MAAYLPSAAHSSALSRSPQVVARTGLRASLAEQLPALQAHAIKLVRDRAEATDLVQDTIERALRFEHSYQEGTNLRGWLHQILFSVFITRCRRQRRERNALSALGTDPCEWTHDGAVMADAELSPGLQRALATLGEGFRDVLLKVDLNEQSYREVADELGVPVGTVMSRVFRARRKLAELVVAAAA